MKCQVFCLYILSFKKNCCIKQKISFFGYAYARDYNLSLHKKLLEWIS